MGCLGNVSLVDDGESEVGGPERFQLSLQAPASTPQGQRVIIDPGNAVVAIYDDDRKKIASSLGHFRFFNVWEWPGDKASKKILTVSRWDKNIQV